MTRQMELISNIAELGYEVALKRAEIQHEDAVRQYLKKKNRMR